MSFLNKYRKEGWYTFDYTKEFIENQSFIYALGSYLSNGLILKVDELGEALWEKSYSLQNKPNEFIKFIKIVKLNQNVVYDSEKSLSNHYTILATTSTNLLLIKIDELGEVVSSVIIYEFDGDSNLGIKADIIAHPTKEYFYFVSSTRHSNIDRSLKMICFSNDFIVENSKAIVFKNNELGLSEISISKTNSTFVVYGFVEKNQFNGGWEISGSGFFTISYEFNVLGFTYLQKEIISDIIVKEDSSKNLNFIISTEEWQNDTYISKLIKIFDGQASKFIGINRIINFIELNDGFIINTESDSVKLDFNFDLIWSKKVIISSNENKILRGTYNEISKQICFITSDNSIKAKSNYTIGYTDSDLNSCKTEKSIIPIIYQGAVELLTIDFQEKEININLKEVSVLNNIITNKKQEICPTIIENPCVKNEEICKLYNQILKIFNSCLKDPKLNQNQGLSIIPFVACIKNIRELLQNFNPTYNLSEILSGQIGSLQAFIGRGSGQDSSHMVIDCTCYQSAYSAVEFILNYLTNLGNCNCENQNPCVKDAILCKLYNQLLEIFNECLTNPKNLIKGQKLDVQVACENQFLELIFNFHEFNPNYNLVEILNVHIKNIEIFTNKPTLENYIISYQSIEFILAYLLKKGDCNCVGQLIKPLFDQIGPFCSGVKQILPTTSLNGITGTWSPEFNGFNSGTYIFTPNPGQNASTLTMTVVINPVIMATFNQVVPIIAGTFLAPLPTTSLEGINGVWTPKLNNTQTTTYTFTPTKNTLKCVVGTTMTIVVNPKIVPLNISEYASIQSGSLYLQAAGSLGLDSTKGIHLRWALKGALVNHLPKADYSNNNFNFNKKNDFVRVYRTPYKPKSVVLNFETQPSQITETTNSKKWIYIIDGKVFHIHFRNIAKYNSVKTQTNPQTNPSGFIKNYGNALIEIENKTELSFAVKANFTAITNQNNIRIELLSVEENKISATKGTSLRNEYTATTINEKKLFSENIRSIRFSSDNCFVNRLEFEFYSDFILSNYKPTNNWKYVNSFALTKNTPEAFNRLEPIPNCLNNWLHYNDGTTVNVNNYKTKWNAVPEVENRILEVVTDYISLSESQSNPMALETVNTNDIAGVDACMVANPDYNPVTENTPDNSFEISNLHLLQMGSLDFHVARMLGLGHLETDAVVFDGKYVYLAEYVSFGDLNDGLGEREVQHIYCSLPTGINDQRLPLPVELEEVRNGIFYSPDINPNDPEPAVNEPLTDQNGLSHDGKTQFYTLFAKDLPEEATNAAFYYQNNRFVSADLTIPIYAGLEYRNVTEIPNWRKPELSFDSLYFNTDGVTNETKPIILPESGKPIYVHRERNSGTYEYTSYGINWFSRASTLGAVIQKITTIKPKNLLLPPTNIVATLIQKESPLLFTTGFEQTLLNAFPINADKTLVRLTFEYNHAQELIDYHQKINNELIKDYQELPDTKEFFAEDILIHFRNELPNTISGKIQSVAAGANDVLLVIDTSSYPIYSSGINDLIVPQTVPPTYKENIIPIVPAGMSAHFIGSIMLVDGVEYVIHEVDTNNGNFPKFTIFKSDISGALVDLTTVVNPNNPLSEPTQGSLFVIVENMQQSVSWRMPNPSNFKVKLEPTNVYREEDIQIESPDCSTNSYVQKFRGIYKNAQIEKIKEKVYDNDGDDIPTNSPFTEWHLGLYKITFPGFAMAQHSQYKTNGQNSVEFYNGVVRLHTWNGSGFSKGPRKNFKVVRTENIGLSGNLVLYIEDLTFPKNTTDSNYSTILTSYQGKLMADAVLSNNQFVNYYPGYKVYLYKDPSMGLVAGNIIPDVNQDSHFSMFGLQSHDLANEFVGDNTTDIISPYSAPAFMFAQNIKEPLQPDKPSGGLYATRPDFFGKSSFTFETSYKQKPHSVQFNRASDVQFISALYDNSVLGYNSVTKLPILNTVQQVLEIIFQNGEEAFYIDRWNNLLGFNYNYTGIVPNNPLFPNQNGQFIYYEGKRLPMPNNKKFIEGINYFIDSHNNFYKNLPSQIPHLNVTLTNGIITSVKFGTPATEINLDTEIIPSVQNPDGSLRNGKLQFKDFIKEVLHNCFVPLTEVPVIFDYIKENYKPIPKKQVVRDRNGQLLRPTDLDFDMAPMAVRFKDVSINKTKFTDFGIDGASNARYFYAVREINLQMKTSPYSEIVGPITLVNTAAPTAPEIVKIIPVLENRTLGINASIQLEINSYPEAQNIRKINIYRSDNATDALSIRTMKLVRIIDLEVENLTNDSKWIFTDDFSDLPEVPFGDLLYYKLTVSRIIKYNESDNQTIVDYAPSEASKLVVTNVVENYSPESPVVQYHSEPLLTNLTTLNYITLNWNETAYKSNYYLYKMNAQGNWIEIARITADELVKGKYHLYNTNNPSNNWSEVQVINSVGNTIYLQLEVTNINNTNLSVLSADGDKLYHHFKITAENTAGMFSNKENILTIYNEVSWTDIGGIAPENGLQGMIIGHTFIVRGN